MHVIERDAEHEILKLTFSKHVDVGEARRFRSELEKVLAEFEPGFRVLTDFSDMEEMDYDCVPEIRNIMDAIKERGVSRIVRVVPEPQRDIGLNILSYFHYGRDANVQTYETLPEALEALRV